MNKQELKQLEDDLWKSADTLRANSDLKASECWSISTTMTFKGTLKPTRSAMYMIQTEVFFPYVGTNLTDCIPYL